MPALFAYMIAVGLLLGGGYGALSWLAAPEPVKVLAKAKPRPHSEASRDTASAAPDSPQITNISNAAALASESDKPASASNNQPLEVAATRATQLEASSPPADLYLPATHDVGPVQHKSPSQLVEHRPASAGAVPPAASETPAVASSSSSSASGAKMVKRSSRLQLREASRGPERPAEKRRLMLMTLRTIQYPDGRRVSQLLPYRGSRQALASVRTMN